MPSRHVVRSVEIERTARAMQIEGIFDLPAERASTREWTVETDLPDEWSIGLIVGPSGSGKSTLASELFPRRVITGFRWPKSASVVDGFSDSLGIKDITGVLSSVGFSTPPAWLRPFRVLSTGEQFRATLARAILEGADPIVLDEFTSVVDRTVAKIGSAAVAKTVRRLGKRFVAVTCHEDVTDWLQPDWVLDPHVGKCQLRRSVQRPSITLQVARVHRSAWELFRQHHYLNTKLHPIAWCFAAWWQRRPVAFCAAMTFPHPKIKNVRREHRLVCLPDFQGVGIGAALSEYVGKLCRAQGWRYQSRTAHPGVIASRARSTRWKMIAKPDNRAKTMPDVNMAQGGSSQSGAFTGRLAATFEYVGPPADLPRADVRRAWASIA